jgi:hypothetical protein
MGVIVDVSHLVMLAPFRLGVAILVSVR